MMYHVMPCSSTIMTQYAAHNIGYNTILITTLVGLDHVTLNYEQQFNLHGVIFDETDNKKW